MWRTGLKLLGSITIWSCLAALIGHHLGQQAGYRRGVRDIIAVIEEIRTVDEPPPPWRKGRI